MIDELNEKSILRRLKFVVEHPAGKPLPFAYFIALYFDSLFIEHIFLFFLNLEIFSRYFSKVDAFDMVVPGKENVHNQLGGFSQWSIIGNIFNFQNIDIDGFWVKSQFFKHLTQCLPFVVDHKVFIFLKSMKYFEFSFDKVYDIFLIHAQMKPGIIIHLSSVVEISMGNAFDFFQF